MNVEHSTSNIEWEKGSGGEKVVGIGRDNTCHSEGAARPKNLCVW